MGSRVVVLRADDGIGFVADACAALAEAVNQVRVVRSTDSTLVEAYTETVVAYSELVRRQLSAQDPAETVRVTIIDHLIGRVRQAQAGEITIPVLDVVDRLHGEITRQSASA